MVDWLRSIFLFLFPLGCLLSLVHGIIVVRNSEVETPTESSNAAKSSKMVAAFSTLSGLLVIAFVLCLAFAKAWTWIVLIWGIPALLQQAYSAYSSATVVKAIVTSSDTQKLSYKEKISIILVAGIIWFVETYGVTERIAASLQSIESSNLFDLVNGTFIACRMFAMSFLSCALISIPAEILVMVFRKFSVPVKTCWDGLIAYLAKGSESPVRRNLYTSQCLDWARGQKTCRRVLTYMVVPVVGIIDILAGAAAILYGMLLMTVGHVLFFAKEIGGFLIKPIRLLGEPSNKRIVALSFRVAIVTTLTALVIVNRIDPMFRSMESSTAILEFVSSVIIIPMVFEWISSMHTGE